MNETETLTSLPVDALIGRLRNAGEVPPNELVEEFLRRGDAVVAPLVELVRDPAVWAEGEAPACWLPCHAFLLLGCLRDPRGMDAVLDAVLNDDHLEYIIEVASTTAAEFGVDAVPKLTRGLLDRGLSRFSRSAAGEALYFIGCDHPAVRPQVVETFIRALKEINPKEPDEVETGAWLVDDIVNTGDPDARAALVEAVKGRRVHLLFARVESVDALPVVDGWRRREKDRRPRDAIRHSVIGGDRYDERPDAPQPTAPPPRAPEPPRKPEPMLVTKVGRNEPCPCGSGKKYKKCHGA